MLCKNCGSEIAEGNLFCNNCGTAVEAAVEVPETEVITDYVNNEVIEPIAEEQPDGGKVLGIVSLCTSIASYVCSCIGMIPYLGLLVSWASLPCAIAGLITGIIGKKKSAATGHNNTLATVGTILSIIQLVLAVIGLIVGIILGFVIGFGAVMGGASGY